MKILIIPNNTTNNCFGVRNKLPADYLSKLGHEIKIENGFQVYKHPEYGNVIDPGLIDWADAVVFNRHYDVKLTTLRNLILYAKRQGKKVIYETDDLLEGLDWSNPMHESIKAHVPQVRMMMNLADLCTTTGEFLKSEMEKYNDNVAILPNCVEPEKWKLRKGGNIKVRVGYAGGSSHSADTLLVVDIIRDLQKEIDFEFVIFGLAPIQWEKYIKHTKKRHEEQLKNRPGGKPAEWYSKVIQLDEKLKQIKWKHQPFVPLSKYNTTLSKLNFDIGLCPLEDTKFNRCKSCIKFYEYAMVGTCTLASRVSPYREEVNYLAKNKYPNWYSKLKNLILDNKLRERITQQQREWVLKNRTIGSNIHLWEKAYNN